MHGALLAVAAAAPCALAPLTPAGAADGGARDVAAEALHLTDSSQKGVSASPACADGCKGWGPGGECRGDGGERRCACAAGYAQRAAGAAVGCDGAAAGCCVATCALLSSTADCPHPASGTSCGSASAAGCKHEACCGAAGEKPPTTSASPSPAPASGAEGWAPLPGVNLAVQWNWLQSHAGAATAAVADTVGTFHGAESVRIASVAVCTPEYHVCIDKAWDAAHQDYGGSAHGPSSATQSSYLHVSFEIRDDAAEVSVATAKTRLRNCLQPDSQGCSIVSDLFACAADCEEYRPAPSIFAAIHLPPMPQPASTVLEAAAFFIAGFIFFCLLVCAPRLCAQALQERRQDDETFVAGEGASPAVFLEEWRRAEGLGGYRLPESPPVRMPQAADPEMTSLTISVLPLQQPQPRNPRGRRTPQQMSPRRTKGRPNIAAAPSEGDILTPGLPPASASPRGSAGLVSPKMMSPSLYEPATVGEIVSSRRSSDPVAALASVEFTLRRRVGEKLGIAWVDHTVLSAVVDGSLAQREGLGDFVGCRATHVNGQPVQTLGEIQRLIQGVTNVTLTLVKEDLEEGEEWNPRVPTSALPATMLMRRTSTGELQG